MSSQSLLSQNLELNNYLMPFKKNINKTISVSTLVNYFFKYDQSYIAEKKLQNIKCLCKSECDCYKENFNNLIEKWNKNQNIKKGKGISFHKMIENFYKNGITNKNIIHSYNFINFLKYYFELDNIFKIKYIEENFILKINNLSIYGKPDAIFSYKNNFNNFNTSNNYLLKSCFCSYCFKRNKIKIESDNPFLYNFYKDILDTDIIECININNYDDKKEHIVIVDWKLSKILQNNIKFNANHYLKNFFINNKYNKVLIQLNLYRYILENDSNFLVDNMFVLFIKDNDILGEFSQILPIIKLKKEFIENFILNFTLEYGL